MELLPGMECPNLMLHSVDGAIVRLPERAGRAQLVFFFKVECPTSPLAVPALEEVRRKYPADRGGPSVLGISQDEALGTRKWCERYGVSFPVALDYDQFPASIAFGLITVPTTVLVDAGGRIVAVQEGWSRRGYDDLARGVADQTKMPFAPIALEGGPAFQPG